MSIVRLKIDVSGTTGDQAWREINQFDQIQSANFGPQFGSGGLSANPVATALGCAAKRREAEAIPQRRLDRRRNQAPDARSWPNTLFRIIWSKTAYSTPMS